MVLTACGSTSGGETSTGPVVTEPTATEVGSEVTATASPRSGSATATATPPSDPMIEVGSGGVQDFGFSSPSDWISWADQVAVIRVIAEREGEGASPAEVPELRSVAQWVTIEIIDTLWLADNGRSAAGQVEVQGPGFVYIDDVRNRVHDDGALLEVGRTYVVGLLDPARNGSWRLFSPDSNFALEDGVIVSHVPELHQEVHGLKPAELSTVLADTEPVPGVDPTIENLAERFAAFREYRAAQRD